MKDEKYRLYKPGDIIDATPKRAGKNKLKVWCPECHQQHRHRSLVYDTANGAFYCFYCGLHGRILLHGDDNAAATGHVQGKRERAAAAPAASSGSFTEQTIETDLRIEDYVSLPDDTLQSIADISLDPNEQDPHQKAVRRYLEDQKITPEAAVAMRWGVAYTFVKLKDEEQGTRRSYLVYRNYVDGLCCNAKYRSVGAKTIARRRKDGQTETCTVFEKGFTQESAVTPTAPYHIDSLKECSEEDCELIICEGEKDCLVLHQILGYRYVISVSNGAQTDPEKTFAAFRQWLVPFRRIIVCGDMDRPGREMARRMATYFDDREVRVAEWDQRYFGKDITEVYQRRGEEAARDMVLNAMPVVRDDIITCEQDEEIEEICQLGCDLERRDKYSVGIGPLTDRHFMLTPEGGLIIVTGTPNTGKTDFLNYLTTCLMAKRNEAVCFCSFETPNKLRHLARLAQVWMGPTPATGISHERHRQFVMAVTHRAHHLRLRRQQPTATNILHKAETVLRKHPDMKYLVIDPYLYMDVTGGKNITETDAIKLMLTEVQDWAQEHHIWVFIVAHPRKLRKEDGTNELEKIDMYTIAGSANWANIADYILALERVQQDEGRVDYTRMDVLKVRDQEVCTPGPLYYQRQPFGRYDERKDVDACKENKGEVDDRPWRV